MPFQPINPGDRFGLLTVVEQAGYNKQHKLEYVVRCDCGAMLIAQRDGLIDGDVFGCGCSPKNSRSARPPEPATFEYTITPFRERCVAGRVQVIALDGRVLDERPLTMQECRAASVGDCAEVETDGDRQA